MKYVKENIETCYLVICIAIATLKRTLFFICIFMQTKSCFRMPKVLWIHKLLHMNTSSFIVQQFHDGSWILHLWHRSFYRATYILICFIHCTAHTFIFNLKCSCHCFKHFSLKSASEYIHAYLQKNGWANVLI